MALMDALILLAVLQEFHRKLANSLQHLEARLASGLLLPQQTGVNQDRQATEDIETVLAGHDFGRVEGAAADEHPEPSEERLLVGAEQPITPDDGVAHRLMP